MTITYQDKLGMVAVEVDRDHGIFFHGSHAYFSDAEGNDYCVAASAIFSIDCMEE